VIERYETYIIADRIFYERLDQRRTEYPDFPISASPVPEGWEHLAAETWMHYAPVGSSLPHQGWKIHVSSCLDDAERVRAENLRQIQLPGRALDTPGEQLNHGGQGSQIRAAYRRAPPRP